MGLEEMLSQYGLGGYMDQNIKPPQQGTALMSMFRLQDEEEKRRELEQRRLMLLHQLQKPGLGNREAYMQSARKLLDLDLNDALFGNALQQNNRNLRMTY